MGALGAGSGSDMQPDMAASAMHAARHNESADRFVVTPQVDDVAMPFCPLRRTASPPCRAGLSAGYLTLTRQARVVHESVPSVDGM